MEKGSDQPFSVDDGSGQVIVDYGDTSLAGADGVRKVSDRGGPPAGVERGGLLGSISRMDDRGEWYEYEEWVLPAGVPLFVSGEVAQYGEVLALRKPAEGHLVISTKSEDQLLKSGARNARLLEIGAVVCAVGGVALIVAGALS